MTQNWSEMWNINKSSSNGIILKISIQGRGYRSAAKHFCSICEALGFIFGIKENKTSMQKQNCMVKHRRAWACAYVGRVLVSCIRPWYLIPLTKKIKANINGKGLKLKTRLWLQALRWLWRNVNICVLSMRG